MVPNHWQAHYSHGSVYDEIVESHCWLNCQLTGRVGGGAACLSLCFGSMFSSYNGCFFFLIIIFHSVTKHVSPTLCHTSQIFNACVLLSQEENGSSRLTNDKQTRLVLLRRDSFNPHYIFEVINTLTLKVTSESMVVLGEVSGLACYFYFIFFFLNLFSFETMTSVFLFLRLSKTHINVRLILLFLFLYCTLFV